MSPSERAVDAVRSRATDGRQAAVHRWARTTAGGIVDDWSLLEPAVLSAGRLTVNFHPDRTTGFGGTVVEGLAQTGQYLSQWRTGISSGGRTAFPGGDRQRWEHALFGGAYTDVDPGDVAFPVYGAWDLVGDPHGGSPRFGSCFLVLSDDVRERTTMCLGDSHASPADVGTFDRPWCLLVGLAEQADAGTLLATSADPADLLTVLNGTPSTITPRRDLDHYVEAQVHGGIDLRRDVNAVVLDPSFQGTEVHMTFETIASAHNIEMAWHGGSQLAVDDVPDDFRGETMTALAREVAGPNSFINAHSIGVAARSIAVTPMQPGGDSHDSRAQQLKYLWHTLLARGSDVVSS